MGLLPLSPWIGGCILGLHVWAFWAMRSRLEELPDLPSDSSPDQTLPSVCICIPARNEAQEVGPALDSWLAQDFPDLQILVVDDGSTDETPAILAERSRRCPERLRVISTQELPPGWLGKNHALHLASSQPEARRADWILFTDADMRAQPDLLRRAFCQLERQPGDFLSLWPSMETVTFWERLAVPLGAMFVLLAVPPERARDPKSPVAFGAGAFLLVRQAAYEAIGGHWGAPLEALDDVMLACRLKRAGFATRLVAANGALRYRPVHSFQEILASMRKNILALPTLGVMAMLWLPLLLLFFLAPFWLVAADQGWAGLAVWLMVPAMTGTVFQRLTHRPVDPLWALWPLLGPVIAAAACIAFRDHVRGVNHWRGRDVRLRS